ncbi:nicotinamide-nucleotide amidase [Rhodoligotrophos appendicifer]|uniref:CinA family protein n=1 Tax=Rhodoligotrophos appendicifer TaxID=987056 RepID=UPI0011859AEA|nr:CinA family protein [Rhodoligotrophos appendicifer]
MFEDSILRQARVLLEACEGARCKIATAESCTGGLIAACLTEIPGSSRTFERGFVTYSNDAKSSLLGVPFDLIVLHGAVSEPVARSMAEGALSHSLADIAVSVTGVAGPEGGSEDKPVGLVHLACARRDNPTLHRRMLFGPQGRQRIRMLSVQAALTLIEEQLQSGILRA